MNNLSDFANFGEFQIWGGGGRGGGGVGGGVPVGGAKRVCAPGAKNPRYASGYDAPRTVKIGESSLNVAQAHLTLALYRYRL